MIHQELQLENIIYRFELKVNSSESANERAFSLYGILIIPALIGGVLMYNFFQLRDEYLIIPFIVMKLLLVNIYFFYKKEICKEEVLQLIVHNDYIQLMNHQEIYFQEKISKLNIEFIQCGKKLEPAIKLSNENFEGILIGLKNMSLSFPIETENKLKQPDYWLYNKHQAHQLIGLTT